MLMVKFLKFKFPYILSFFKSKFHIKKTPKERAKSDSEFNMVLSSFNDTYVHSGVKRRLVPAERSDAYT